MTSALSVKRIAITSGEPAGIGPDICIQLAQASQAAELIVIADPEMLLQRAKLLKIKLTLKTFNPDDKPKANPKNSLTILPVKLNNPVHPACLDKANSSYVLETIRIATQGCNDGLFSAMVTAPVHKGIINDANITFSGHTEFIAEITGGQPVMMLATPGLRVALVTTHLPLSKVSSAITAKKLDHIISILDHDMRKRFHIKHPKILICGLNPHAGEDGYLGREEIDIIEPSISKLQQQGMNLQGPLPADTLFTPKYLKSADAVLAMYHDQGLPVLKFKGFGQAVNITLGLPIIRTSVDHGTALDLAGTGKASISSLQYAVDTALEMTASNQDNYKHVT